MKRTAVLICGLLACLTYGQSASIPAEKQIEVGERTARTVRGQGHILPADDPRSQLVRAIGRRLQAACVGLPNDNQWHYSFETVLDKDLNAYAVPGGPVFVNTGLLDKLQTQDQLAGVMGHEITHVRNEHWAKQYVQKQERTNAVQEGAKALGIDPEWAKLAEIPDALIIGTYYSRQFESEADHGGVELAAAAGFNPQGLADSFRIVEAGSEGEMPEFLSSHPDTQARISAVEAQIAQMHRTFPPQISLQAPVAETTSVRQPSAEAPKPADANQPSSVPTTDSPTPNQQATPTEEPTARDTELTDRVDAGARPGKSSDVAGWLALLAGLSVLIFASMRLLQRRSPTESSATHSELAWLEIQTASGNKRRSPLSESKPCVLGRGRPCELRVDDPKVSDAHARIAYSQHQFTLTDLGSRNGTLVNGQKVSIATLRDGDVIEIGSIRLRFRQGAERGA